MSIQVASQTRGFPEDQGMMDIPSGRLPSTLDKPGGSKREGMFAEESDLKMTLLRAACLECLPSLFLQLKLCLPKESTDWPHLWHWWGEQRGVPRRRPTAILTESSSSRRPRFEIGKACNQAPDSLTHGKMPLGDGLCRQYRKRCQATV